MAKSGDIRFPLFVKAVAGGGGRGIRRVTDLAALPEAIEAASRESESAFGDPPIYLEQAVIKPRHIEVQILADNAGNVIHLYERDCSVQRRHQKVVELDSAPNLSAELRDKICADAFARHIGYSFAGTVEFLLDESGEYVFIEMRIRPTDSGPTPAGSASTAAPAGRAPGWTVAPTWVPRSARTSIPCWSS
ncbi:ATP-binding protein [Mycobacterium tilburgii]|uniref:ATP-binding protein n=1 Tax=Mycobacterium tilburgii TaxID=44467 RepID=UPI003898F809